IAAITMSCLAIALLPTISRQLALPAGSGWLAGAAMALFPINLWVETSGSWEQPAAALALLGILVTIVALHKKSWQSRPRALLLGLLMGVTALLSPPLLPAVFLALVSELSSHKIQVKPVLSSIFIAGMVSLVFVGPWAWRNYCVLGGWVPL